MIMWMMPTPARVISLDRKTNRTFHYWHIFVPGLGRASSMAIAVYGPMEPENGLRFDMEKVLLDPYGRLVATPPDYDRGACLSRPGDNTASAMKSVVVDLSNYDLGGRYSAAASL